MTKIKELTPEQEAYLPVYHQEIIDIASGKGAPFNREKTEESLRLIYERKNGGRQFKQLLMFPSPKAANTALAMARAEGEIPDEYESMRWDEWPEKYQREKLDSRYLWGSHDLYWLARHKFGQYIGVKYKKEDLELLDALLTIGYNIEWWWPFENFIFASHLPLKVQWNNGVIHNDRGPAVLYRDDFAIWAFRGRRLPKSWIMDKDNVNPTEVIGHPDVETRAAGGACIGWHRLLSAVPHKILDDSGDPVIGRLVEISLPGLSSPGRYLMAECPRNGTICEGVPLISEIDNKSITKAIHAQAWRIGDPQDEYTLSPRRT